MIEGNSDVRESDVIEFTLRGERRTAEAMLITDDGLVLLDPFHRVITRRGGVRDNTCAEIFGVADRRLHVV